MCVRQNIDFIIYICISAMRPILFLNRKLEQVTILKKKLKMSFITKVQLLQSKYRLDKLCRFIL